MGSDSMHGAADEDTTEDSRQRGNPLCCEDVKERLLLRHLSMEASGASLALKIFSSLASETLAKEVLGFEGTGFQICADFFLFEARFYRVLETMHAEHFDGVHSYSIFCFKMIPPGPLR
eukprot:TRINITY_DN5217_c0_g4_i4.p1 TRINITY_DN5217_c0_g4~~TRINITY_DN5217_c0_g4_i4.p1  ORF type:complete len:119 (+),score=13.51 TRINITY_DN5217_c0_g4_i4:637-993(+)